MHYHSSSKYLSKTESVEVFILPCIFHLKLLHEFVSRRRERSSRFWALVGIWFHYKCRTILCITLLRHNVGNVNIIGLLTTVTLLDPFRNPKWEDEEPLAVPAVCALILPMSFDQMSTGAECSRQEEDSQGRKTNTQHLFCSCYLNQVRKKIAEVFASNPVVIHWGHTVDSTK